MNPAVESVVASRRVLDLIEFLLGFLIRFDRLTGDRAAASPSVSRPVSTDCEVAFVNPDTPSPVSSEAPSPEPGYLVPDNSPEESSDSGQGEEGEFPRDPLGMSRGGSKSMVV
jgi:hypothetical protein